jgi:hypothetical protein
MLGDFTPGLADIPDLDLVAIEPLQGALETLRQRVETRNRAMRVVGAALSDRPGIASVHVRC